jgi:hypothetical protein
MKFFKTKNVFCTNDKLLSETASERAGRLYSGSKQAASHCSGPKHRHALQLSVLPNLTQNAHLVPTNCTALSHTAAGVSRSVGEHGNLNFVKKMYRPASTAFTDPL